MKIQTLKNQATFGVIARALRYEHSRICEATRGYGGFHCFEHEAWCARTEVLEWCDEQFGPEGRRWSYTRDGSTVYVQHDTDAFAFKMRWC